MAICHRKACDVEACGHDQRHQHQTQHTKQNINHDCASGEHAHTFLRVHHILPRCTFHEHTRQLSLKAPTLVFIFFLVNTCDTFTPIFPTRSNVRCAEAIKGLVSFFWNQAQSSHSATSWHEREVHMKLCWVTLLPHACLSPPTSPLVHSPTCVFIFVTTDTLHALKKRPQKQVHRLQHFTLCKAINDLRGFAVLQTDALLSLSGLVSGGRSYS